MLRKTGKPASTNDFADHTTTTLAAGGIINGFHASRFAQISTGIYLAGEVTREDVLRLVEIDEAAPVW